MTILRRITIALLAAALLAPGAARAASTTNYSDQWWVATESGWGASVLQQWDVLFIDLFVYGPDGKPTWFTAAATYQSSSPAGHVLFSGDLYSTTRPYFGAGTFNPGAVGYAKVGTLTFDADSVSTATLTYTVGGVPVAKNVTRQTWRNENLSGSYYGGFVWDQPCEDGTDNDPVELFGTLQFNHNADNTVRIDLQITSAFSNGVPQPIPANATASITGPYTQSGHMGRIQGTFKYGSGQEVGTLQWNLFEIERTINGITGRFSGQVSGDGCKVYRRYDGRFGGVRR